MYSLNVPVPGRIERLASDLFPRLTAFDRVRDRHTLVCKRFEAESLPRLRKRLRRALDDSPSFEARVDGIDYFERPISGSGPVVYLAVESLGLLQLHDRLVDAFGAVPGLEGDDYTPHVTLARSGTIDAASELASLDIDPVVWTVSELHVWDPRYRETVARIGLPK
ncbi:MAG: 2'-5' RNA ligase family protein [Halobacteriota archaeon]